MICLGIESTAHTFGIGIVDNKLNILANIPAVFRTEKGGMIPSEVAAHHKAVKEKVISDALTKAKLTWKDIDLISYSHGPGLAPSLLVGLDTAKTLALKHKKPLVGVNHSVAHLTIGDGICKTRDPVYLYVSGANTQLIARAGNYYRIFGETLDIGLGNALDKFGREAGLGFPAGPKIEELAKKGKWASLPYVVKGMDVSFAGIVTNTTTLLKKGTLVEDICFSFQETTFAMLAEISERALTHCEKKELLLIGGVAANKRLIEMLTTMCKDYGARFEAVPLQYSGDQGVMIAWQGLLQKDHTIDPQTADIYPYQRTDQVKITW